MDEDTLSPAEASALRTLMGLSQDHLAAMLGVHRRTVRSWESGRDRTSPSSSAAVRALVSRHDELVAQCLDATEVIGITRDVDVDTIPPRGWYLAAAGRAMGADPDLMIEWV